MNESLFGHLVSRFSSSPENLATEALCYILNRSHIARESFRNLLDHLHIALPPEMRYATQDSGSDGAIPDLVGRDANGKPVLYGEAKFWAGLTDNQPVTYLQRLFKANGKAVFFLAPAKRFPTLWPELLRRCSNAGFQTTAIDLEIPEIKILKVQDNHYLLLLSWRVVLNTIRQALEAEGDHGMVSNLIQLQGLCTTMDDAAFLPIRSEEITSNTSQRILQYMDLVDEVTEILVSQKFVSTKGLRATGARGVYIRYMVSNEVGYSLTFSPILWDKYGSTPLWLGIAKTSTPQWEFYPEARERLMQYEMATPPLLYREGHYLFVPLFLKIGIEKPEVVKSLIEQIKRVHSLISAEE